ncbi:MAG: HIG1 domain-containing protein [Sphingomonadales bacterium]|nr:HIG1 domain-containing protein [Sphingomonadales bacterium]
MTYLLVPVIIVLVAMVVISLVKGIAAFMQSTRTDLERGDGPGATEMQLLQNKMMFARIKYQAAAVLVVGLLLAISKS